MGKGKRLRAAGRKARGEIGAPVYDGTGVARGRSRIAPHAGKKQLAKLASGKPGRGGNP